MLKNRKILTFLILIILCCVDACETPKNPLARYNGTYSKGSYSSPNREFVASIPYPDSITRITDKQLEGKFIVDIEVTPSSGRGLYRYSIEWFDSKSAFSTQESFNKYMIENISKYISSELEISGQLEFIGGKNVIVSDEITGYMFIGSGFDKKIRERARSIYGIYIPYSQNTAILYVMLKRKINKVEDIKNLPDFNKFMQFYESFYTGQK
jgi:hypothetical protein